MLRLPLPYDTDSDVPTGPQNRRAARALRRQPAERYGSITEYGIKPDDRDVDLFTVVVGR